MSTDDDSTLSTDLIRWTFSVAMGVAGPVHMHLADLGAEVFVRGETFHVFWEETDVNLDAVVESIWEIAGDQFEITQEELHRLELHVLHPDEPAGSEAEAEADDEATEFHPGVDSLEIREL